jgi:hypothetical protein
MNEIHGAIGPNEDGAVYFVHAKRRWRAKRVS